MQLLCNILSSERDRQPEIVCRFRNYVSFRQFGKMAGTLFIYGEEVRQRLFEAVAYVQFEFKIISDFQNQTAIAASIAPQTKNDYDCYCYYYYESCFEFSAKTETG